MRKCRQRSVNKGTTRLERRRRSLYEILEQRLALDTQIGSVTMPIDGYLSAGVFGPNGELVRTLFSRLPQEKGVSIPLVWDGLDDVGRKPLVGGAYSWKALTSQVVTVNEGNMADSVYTNQFDIEKNFAPDMSSNVRDVAADASGNLYQLSAPVENSNGFQQYGASGALLQRYVAQGYGLGVATDGTYLYASYEGSGLSDFVAKSRISDGANIGFTSAGTYITVNSGVADPRPAGQNRFTTLQSRTRWSAWGIDVDSHRIWVSDYRNNTVKVYDKVTGSMLGELRTSTIAGAPSFFAPLGVAIEASSATSGTAWIAYKASGAPTDVNFKGDTVAQFTYTVSSGVYSFTKNTTITADMDDPSGLTFGGPSNHLFVGLTGSDQIKEYTTAGTLAGLQTFGTQQVGGALADNAFVFETWAGLAIDPSGVLNVVDHRRVQRFYTTAGGGHTAGELKQSLFGVFEGFPIDTFGYTPDGRFFITQEMDTFEVDPNWTGGPRAGWLGDGSWRMATRDVAVGFEDDTVYLHRTLMDGSTPREFRFAPGIDGVDILSVNPATGASKHVATYGGLWWGYDRIQNPTAGGRWSWFDTNGDGAMTENEITRYIPLGQNSGLSQPFVDEIGTIWIPQDGKVVKFTLQGFSGGIPQYNFDSPITVVAAQSDFAPYHVKVAGNGDIWATGSGPTPPPNFNPALPGAGWIARFDSSGNRLLLRVTPDSTIPAFGVDKNPTSSTYIATGHARWDEGWIYLFDADGLVVAKATPGAVSNYSNSWIDQAWGVGMVTHPYSGKTYLFGSDVAAGKVDRHRVDNLNTISRSSGTFAWTVPVEVSGRWQLDDNLLDSAAHNDGVFNGGSATYVYGPQGKAIDLNGSSQSVVIPHASSNIAYSLSAWVRPTSTIGVNVAAITGGAGLTGTMNQIRINKDGRFEHYTHDVGAGVARRVTGSTVVQPNTWYLVTITAENSGLMRLYVNGEEEGTAESINRLFSNTATVQLGGAGTVDTPNWLDGSIDDVRVYQQALSAADVRAIYDEANLAADGYWALDGNLNDTAGGNSGTFNGAGAATYSTGMFGSALNFNGTENYVSALYATDPETYTISAWIKRTDSGADNIITRTSTAGPAVVFSHQLRIDSSGKFEHYTDDGVGKVVTSTTTARTGVWYHVVGTAASNGFMRLYVNGVEEGTAQSVGTLSTAGDRYFIGSNSGGGMGYFAGAIDDVHVYNEVASAADIRDWFLRGESTDYTGHWNFDGNLNDSAGTVHGAYLPSGSPSYAAGKLGSALSLDGTHYVNLPYTNDPDSYTISAWIRPTFRFIVQPGLDRFIPMNVLLRTNVSGPTSFLTDQLRLTEDDNVKRFEFISKSDKGDHLIIGTTPIATNTWYHIAIVAESNGMMHLFLNGKEEGTPIQMGNLLTSSDRWQVGNLSLGGIDYYSGLVDDLRIYQRPLTRMEVESTINGKANPDIVLSPANVSVKATDFKASETGQDPGVFTISRDGNALNALLVHYTLSGTAANGFDYAILSGSVTIPAGELSATVTLVPTDDADNDPSDTVVLTVSPSANYFVGTPASATIVIADNELSGDVAWLGSNNTANSNDFGWKNSSVAGGATGEIGGTFARSLTDSYYADVNLAQPVYGLSSTLSASGKLDFTISGWNASGSSGMFIGHFSTNPNSKEFVGLELMDESTTTVRWRARVQAQAGGGEDSPWLSLAADSPTENHTFSYTYDPNLGGYGRITLTVDSTTVTADLQDGTRFSGAAFDAFGIGYTNSMNSQVNPAAKANIFFDDLAYSGQVTLQLPTVTIAAADSSATEQGATTGTYTISRTNTVGSLVVNFTSSGGTSGLDYVALPTFVALADGQASATVTLTPIDDGIAENSEPVTITLSPSTNYVLGVPKSASVTIVDNEPIVNVTATDGSAAEIAGDNGVFTFKRTGTSGNLTVNYTVSGTASGGTDYAALAGSVVIPDGSSSVDVILMPLNDSFHESSETATVEIVSSTGFTIGSTNRATVIIVDDDAPGDPGWTGVNNNILGNNYGWSPLTKEAGGARGEIGGTFTRSQFESFYGDTNLTGSLTVNNVITASGKFDLHNISRGWAEGADGVSSFFIGHFSESLANGDRAGLEFERHRPDAVRVYARFGGADGNSIAINADGNHTFQYTYDPNLGAYGRITILIDAGTPNALTPIYVDLNAGERAAGITLDTFGMLIPGNKNSNTSSAKTMEAYIDDVSYSGQQIPPPLIPGDFDGDSDVDGADFVAWQTHFPTASGATRADGDSDSDGDVDGADFVAWQTHFPTPAAPGVAQGGSAQAFAAGPDPEPVTAVEAPAANGNAYQSISPAKQRNQPQTAAAPVQSLPAALQTSPASAAKYLPVKVNLQSSVSQLSRIRILLWQQSTSDSFASVFANADFGRISRADAVASIYVSARRQDVELDENATAQKQLKALDTVEEDVRHLGQRRRSSRTFVDLMAAISCKECISR